jgi:hypothetical protein
LVTTRLVAVDPAARKVHDAVIEVADTTMAVPQVAFGVLDDTEALATKPVPVIVKATVESAVADVGLTAVIVGPLSMLRAAVVNAVTTAVPPSVFVMV